jgi:2-amino-4-hydroxy-6-hydroxymethyldihydropteridine diphosphokinase
MSIAFIGIGSNLGNREGNCLRAIGLLKQKGLRVKRHSSLYETEPWGVRDQPSFLNMAVELETDCAPGELFRRLKEIESELGREKTYKWGPRVIDLDILVFDNLIMNEHGLCIPHPLMHKRDFVLKPLAELVPDMLHPVLNVSISELLQQLETF